MNSPRLLAVAASSAMLIVSVPAFADPPGAAPLASAAPAPPISPAAPSATTTRPGLWGPGIALTMIGLATVALSVPLLTAKETPDGNFAPIGAVAAAIGGIHLAVGIPLIAFGVKPVSAAPTSTGSTWITPTPATTRTVGLAWSF